MQALLKYWMFYQGFYSDLPASFNFHPLWVSFSPVKAFTRNNNKRTAYTIAFHPFCPRTFSLFRLQFLSLLCFLMLSININYTIIVINVMYYSLIISMLWLNVFKNPAESFSVHICILQSIKWWWWCCNRGTGYMHFNWGRDYMYMHSLIQTVHPFSF